MAIADVLPFLKPHHFYSARHRHVYAAMAALLERAAAIDYHTIAQELRHQGTYEQAGGLEFLAEVDLGTPSAAHIEYYARIVLEHAVRRRYIGASQQVAEMAWDQRRELDIVKQRAEALILGAASDTLSRRAVVPPEEWTEHLLEYLGQVASRLDQCFRLLTGGPRTAVRRHHTLWATIDWSYQLLSEQERSLVRRLAMFASGWSLEAAEAVGADAVRREDSVCEVLGQLVAKSMVLVEKPRETTPNIIRYRLLETIRQYAEEKLVEIGEADLARARHRDWCLAFADQAAAGMEGADQKLWWDRLNVEHDNLRMALTWSAALPDELTPLLRLAGLLGRFWALNGFASEGVRWLKLALAQSDPTPSSDRARALDWLGALEQLTGHVERACSLLDESVAQARSVGDRRVLTLALRHLSRALRSVGDVERASTLIEEAVAISRDESFTSQLAWGLVLAAEQLESEGQLESVEPLLFESLSAGRQSGAITSVNASTGALARLYIARGDFARARHTVDEALALAGELGMHLPMVSLLITRGDVVTAERDWESADDWYRQALSRASLVGARGTAAVALRHYAAMCATRGDPNRAVRIVAATSLIGQAPLVVQPTPLTDDDVIAVARRTLGEDAFALAWAEGRTMTLEQAVTQLVSSGCE